MKDKLAAWFKSNRKKLMIWGVIIIAVTLGFVHQYIIHTDSHIKGFIEKNKAEYTAAAQLLLDRPTTDQQFLDNVYKYDTAVKPDNKFPVETLMENPVYSGSTDILEKISDLGTQDVKSDGTTVRFYQTSRFVVIYSPEKEEISGAKSCGDGWFYISSF